MAKGVSFNSSEYTSKYDPIFQNTDYWDTYQSIVNQYKDGVPYNWFRGLTGKHSTDVYNHKMAYSNALNALVDQMRVDEYNAPGNQAQLERQAGLNPDITGISGSGQTESASAPNENLMQFENPIPHITSFLTMISGAVSVAQNFASQQLVNDNMRLTNLGLMNDIALTGLSRSDIDFSPLPDEDVSPAFTLGFQTGSRSLNKRLDKTAKSFIDSIPYKIAKKNQEKEIASIRSDIFDIKSQPYYSDDDETLNELASMLSQQYEIILQAQKISELSKYSADDESYKRSKQLNELWNKSIDGQSRIMKYLRKRAEKGGPLATKILFSIFGQNSSLGVPDATSLVDTATNVYRATKGKPPKK